MSRVIKFRAWSKEFKHMLDNKRLLLLGASYAEMQDDSHEWMQFTGLLDKNGKEIYEGDIVSPGNGFSLVVDSPCGSHEYDIREGWEIIGNIYENPELISKA